METFSGEKGPGQLQNEGEQSGLQENEVEKQHVTVVDESSETGLVGEEPTVVVESEEHTATEEADQNVQDVEEPTARLEESPVPEQAVQQSEDVAQGTGGKQPIVPRWSEIESISSATGGSGEAKQSYQWPPGTMVVEREPGRLACPLPRWVFLSSVVLVVALLVTLHLTGSDWAGGAANAGGAALLIALGLTIAVLVRTYNGMSSSLNLIRRRQYTVSIVCILALVSHFVTFQFLQSPLHLAQAHTLEGQQQWQAAIKEYALGGESSLGGEDLARVYVEWGQALNKDQHYKEAIDKFGVVIGQLSGVSDQLKRAEAGDIEARVVLGQQSLQQKDYTAATTQFDALLQLSYCDDACKKQASVLDAAAYYNLGEADLQAKEYAAAVSAFDLVLTRFTAAPEARQLHSDMAKALLENGKAIRGTSCHSAIPTYQRLAKEFGDTAEGKTAQGELNAPQQVKGHFTNDTPDFVNFTQIGLTQGLRKDMATSDLARKWDSAVQTTAIDGNGNFVFQGALPGDYDLIWEGDAVNGGYRYVEFIYMQDTGEPKYIVHVDPLCSVDVGEVSNKSDFPTLVPPIPTLVVPSPGG